MKAPSLPSSCPEDRPGQGLALQALRFLGNGPYSMAVAPGECVGLTGPSGVGKTQLLRAIADVIVHEGDCLLDSVSCSLFSPTLWRRTVAMVPAESFWWYDTVGPHFSGGLEQNETENGLEMLGFSREVAHWRISRLSTGERQRLSLLRTLVNGPRVLLLDEPTSALDRRMVLAVEQMIGELCRTERLICLWVSHDREQLARVADRVYLVEPHGLSAEGA